MERTQCLERFVGIDYKNAHLSQVILAPETHADLLEWLKPPIQNFLIFQGCVGCGKTWTSIAIARHLFDLAAKKRDYPSVFFYPQAKIFTELKGSYNNDLGEAHLMSRYQECLVLVIDDFGSSSNTPWQKEKMFEIISERYANSRPTLITTNLSFDEIEEIYGPRMRSRLEAMKNLIINEWSRDLRQEGL